ncbi:ABC transporter substrate-binding protein [Sphingopyxis sp.]|jgi:branched-chain amino acid transport system substrate-binding protein|uniref:ABC transporter substrate-binding protein n=1 Tax=Sphingopyxis sp. TaxID=1908224 RepID=UPI002DEF5E9B|nr:ABC transporter substrate-binding protein [Sphingopyxis sp.]
MIEDYTRRFVISAAALMVASRSSLFDGFRSERRSIRVGHTTAYSGPASAYGTIGRTEIAFFRMINAKGGINGRPVDFITYDDAYSPSKTVEHTRRLVELDKVDLLFHQSGTANIKAISDYVTRRGIPTLFVATGASKWDDPARYPRLMGWGPSYASEAATYARHALATVPGARIGLLYQNDDFGRDYLSGVREVLGPGAAARLAAVSYAVTDATIDGAISSLKASGANVLIIAATPKFAAQAIRRTYELGWRARRYLSAVSTSLAEVLRPAGLEAARGLISAHSLKDPSDKAWARSPDLIAYRRFMAEWNPGGDPESAFNVIGYAAASSLVAVLSRCGDDFSAENIMARTESLRDVEIPMLLPGVRMTISPTDHAPISSTRMMRFDGAHWELFGGLVDSAAPSRGAPSEHAQ